MIATAAVLLALAGAPAQTAPAPNAQAPVEVLAQNRVDQAERAAARQRGFSSPEERAKEGSGHGEKIDFLAHIQDSREWELPGGKVVHFPEAGSWMLGPLDVTPTKHVLFLAIAGVLTVLTLLGGAGLAARAERGLTAGKRHNAIEALVLFIRNEVVMPNVGHGGEKFAPFVCTLFFFILFCNLMGLIPFGSTPTASISVTAALALVTFLVVEVGAIVAMGFGHWIHTIWFVPKGMHPVAGNLMALFLMPVEIVGKIVRPVALTIRLMANMTAGHIVLLAIISLIFVFGSWALALFPVLMGIGITFLELFVAFLQAFIFAMLAAVFIGLVRHAH